MPKKILDYQGIRDKVNAYTAKWIGSCKLDLLDQIDGTIKVYRSEMKKTKDQKVQKEIQEDISRLEREAHEVSNLKSLVEIGVFCQNNNYELQVIDPE